MLTLHCVPVAGWGFKPLLATSGGLCDLIQGPAESTNDPQPTGLHNPCEILWSYLQQWGGSVIVSFCISWDLSTQSSSF